MFYVVDVEADGPAPGLFSMVSMGVVRVEPGLPNKFYAEFAPISEKFIPEALKVGGFTREQHLSLPDPEIGMHALAKFLEGDNRPVFVSDNPAFDWQWVNYYSHLFLGKNPFGHSARRIGDIYSGMRRNLRDTNGWKKWRLHPHTHNALDDAIGNANAMLEIMSMIQK